MILPREYWEKNIAELTDKPYNYSIVKTDHLPYQKNKDRLERGIDIINLCNSLSIVNEAYKNIGINKSFDFTILYQVLEVVYSDKTFTDEQLEQLYIFEKKLDEFYEGMKFISPGITEYLYLDSEVKLLLLGFGFESQSEFSKLDAHEYDNAIDYQFMIERKYFAGELSVEKVKKYVLKHFTDTLNEVKARKKKEKLKCA